MSAAITTIDHKRPPLRWITRRARCWLNAFPLEIARREAIRMAATDYAWFMGMRSTLLLEGARGND